MRSAGVSWNRNDLTPCCRVLGLNFHSRKFQNFIKISQKWNFQWRFGFWDLARQNGTESRIVWNWFKKHHKSFSKTNKQVKLNKSCCWPITIQISHFDRADLDYYLGFGARLETKHYFSETVKILTTNRSGWRHVVHVMTSRGGII